jgi:hypothetical protein
VVLIAKGETADAATGDGADPAEFLNSVLQSPDIRRKVC